MMCKILIFMLALVAAPVLRAQSLDAFKERLATPVHSEAAMATARVSVVERGDAAGAVAQASRNNSWARMRGYRVCIFFDNGQDGRAGANAAKSLFETNYPGIKVYMVYETPYYKVSVGNCLTAEEAIILKGQVIDVFPKAFVKNEEFSLTELLD